MPRMKKIGGCVGGGPSVTELEKGVTKCCRRGRIGGSVIPVRQDITESQGSLRKGLHTRILRMRERARDGRGELDVKRGEEHD